MNPKVFPLPLDFSHVEIEGLASAGQLRQRVGLVGLEQVEREKIRRSRRIGKHGDTRSAQAIGYGGNGSVSARGNDHIEVFGVVEKAVYRRGSVG